MDRGSLLWVSFRRRRFDGVGSDRVGGGGSGQALRDEAGLLVRRHHALHLPGGDVHWDEAAPQGPGPPRESRPGWLHGASGGEKKMIPRMIGGDVLVNEYCLERTDRWWESVALANAQGKKWWFIAVECSLYLANDIDAFPVVSACTVRWRYDPSPKYPIPTP